jgi:hypothetical protein
MIRGRVRDIVAYSGRGGFFHCGWGGRGAGWPNSRHPAGTQAAHAIVAKSILAQSQHPKGGVFLVSDVYSSARAQGADRQ